MVLCGNLSEDLVVEILSRIPAKSLVKFKSVCRSWLELIGDPSFIVKHHQTRAAITNNGCFVSRCYSDKYKGSRWWFLYRDGESADIRHGKVHPPYPNWREAEICAAADGIFYIHGFSGIRSDDYYLWNPSTRELTSVTHRRRSCTQTHDIIGLGFDFKSGYVKVLRTYTIIAREGSPTSTWTLIAKAAVWTSRDGCWRELDNVSPLTADMRSRRKQIYVGGRCYWYVTTKAEKTILCFDIVDEKFGLLPLPATLINCEDPYRENMIIELKQSLGIVCFPPLDAESVDIWLMSHEVNWSKYLTLRVSPRSIYTYCPFKLFFMERDVIFVDLEGYFFFQNLSTERANFFSTNLITKYSSFSVYNESIISFKVKDSKRSRLEREIKNCPKYFRSRSKIRSKNCPKKRKHEGGSDVAQFPKRRLCWNSFCWHCC